VRGVALNEHAVGVGTGLEAGAGAFLRRFAWRRGHADVWRVFTDSEAFAAVVAALIGPWRAKNVTKVCGIEARGFILGGAAAYGLGVGFVAIRKEGHLFPGPKRRVEAALDYRGMRHVLEIQQQSVRAGDRVLLVDDWIERGSHAEAARELIENCGGEFVGMAVLVDELDDEIRDALPALTSILSAGDLPSDQRYGFRFEPGSASHTRAPNVH
jgi:adenine phosphoribosyltransferase